jgi:hypothetical protein
MRRAMSRVERFAVTLDFDRPSRVRSFAAFAAFRPQ